MGRTSKFTFPIPHRRQRPEPLPTISVPLTKAQKILGTGEINIDSPTLPKDQSKHWETRSNSGISVTISESTASYGGTELGTVHEGRVTRSSHGRSKGNVEQESEIIPRGLIAGARSPGALGYDLEDMITDASSIRRRQSSSTITSFYDKSQLPLSISQQTSNSAMAKGLPSKASALLDMEGTALSPKETKKKKPAMLDLSHLLPRHKSSSKSPQLEKGMVLGPDMMTRSPSMLSVSPGITPPPAQQNAIRTIRKKLTKESLRSQQSEYLSPSEAGTSHRRPGHEANGLHNLYEHYEHASLRDAMNAEEQMSPAPGKHRGGSANRTRSSSTNLLASPSKNGGLVSTLRKPSSSGHLSGADTPLTAVMSPPGVNSPAADYAASISSRHTRTSKASKRTDQSFSDFNLQQNSVLSLSSDSEDDFPEPPKTALSVPTTVSSREDELENRRPRTSRSDQEAMRNKDSKHASFATKNQYLTIPERVSASPRAPAIAPRSSSLSTARSGAASTNTGSSIRSSSRISTLSSETSNSNAGQPNPKANGDVREALAITMVPTQARHRNSPPRQQQAGYHPSARTGSRSSQPTPPLSPSSVDFFLRSQHNSLSEDGGSMRSSQNGEKAGHTSIDGRFMAVTKQEEMLLAALRMKRARMRETILAEFEEELERVDNEQERSQSAASKKHSRRSSVSTVTQNDLHPRPVARDSSTSNGRAAGQTQQGTTRADSRQLNRLTTSSKQVLLYLDRPAHSVDAYDAAEPSPDLSDFMEFDETSNSDDYPFQASDNHSPITAQSSSSPGSSAAFLAPPSSTWNSTSTRSRPDSTPLSPKSLPRRMAIKDHDVHVRILEHPIDTTVRGEEIGVPRPDSPISPEGYMEPEVSSPLPRKKAVRISAVGTGRVGMEAGWWDHDG